MTSKLLDGQPEAYFRGRKLNGREIKIPEGYRGVVVKGEAISQQETKQRGRTADVGGQVGTFDEEMELLEEVGEYDQVVVWGHETIPEDDDVFVKGVNEWTSFAESVSKYRRCRRIVRREEVNGRSRYIVTKSLRRKTPKPIDEVIESAFNICLVVLFICFQEDWRKDRAINRTPLLRFDDFPFPRSPLSCGTVVLDPRFFVRLLSIPCFLFLDKSPFLLYVAFMRLTSLPYLSKNATSLFFLGFALMLCFCFLSTLSIVLFSALVICVSLGPSHTHLNELTGHVLLSLARQDFFRDVTRSNHVYVIWASQMCHKNLKATGGTD